MKTLALLLCLSAASAAAQQPNPIPIRKVTVLASTDSGAFRSLSVLRPLSNGSVLVVDQLELQLILIDSTFKHVTVIADAAGKAPTHIGSVPGGLLPFTGDSTAYVDQDANALLVVSSSGQVGRTMAPPNSESMRFFIGRDFGNPGFDSRGRLYYRTANTNVPFFPGANDTTWSPPDSVSVVRADLDTRGIDSLAKISIQVAKHRFVHDGTRVWNVTVVNPLPAIDDWAFFRDGTLAIVRAHDYHVDWIMPDGTKRSTPKMPFAWRAINPDEKQAIVDSVKRQLDSAHTALVERVAASASAAGARNANGTPAVPPASIVVPAAELPDYYPPIVIGSRMRFDPDGNLWILPATSNMAVGGLLYDVVNRNGEIIERVQMPPGCRLNGFGPNGIIYLLYSLPPAPSRVQRAHIER